LGETEGEIRDCTVLNRLLIQGPDPLFLMETCPREFEELCGGLGLSVKDGRAAIEMAHWKGPGCLLVGQGITHDTVASPNPLKEWRQEALWLILAAMSDCTEEGYGVEISIVERLQTQVRMVRRLISVLEVGDLMSLALAYLKEFTYELTYTVDEKGIPHATKDTAFYLLYKQGFKCVAVHTKGPVFYGTTPDTTLVEQGVEVDKQISPQFGLIFPKT
jgi:hypothetical protein